jgi:hypothetical protein
MVTTGHHHTDQRAGIQAGDHVRDFIDAASIRRSAREVSIEIKPIDINRYDGSMFLAEGTRHAYRVNPKEHPVITGFIDHLLEQTAAHHGTVLERESDSQGYLTALHSVCPVCGERGCHVENTSNSSPNLLSGERRVDELLKSYGLTTTKSETGNDSLDEPRLITSTQQCLGPAGHDSVDTLTLGSPSTGVGCFLPDVGTEEFVECDQIRFVNKGLLAPAARVFGLLRALQEIRENPMSPLNRTALDIFDGMDTDDVSNATRKTFQQGLDEVFNDTPSGGLIEWAVLGTTEPRPVEALSEVVNVSLAEIKAMAAVWNAAGIVTQTYVDGELAYGPSPDYDEWCENNPVKTMPYPKLQYVKETQNIGRILNEPFPV